MRANYRQVKRQKELARKMRQNAKQQRKAGRSPAAEISKPVEPADAKDKPDTSGVENS